MTVRQINPLKQQLTERQTSFGLWATLTSSIATEIAAGSGADWVLIDMEHSANDVPSVLAQVQAMNGARAEAVVRLPNHDSALVKQLMDCGVRSLMFPSVNSAAEARAVVAATRYPPAGIRGFSVAHRGNDYGRNAGYAAQAADMTCVIVQIETPEAVGNVDAIADVDGVDCLFVGPSDLAATLGHLGNPMHDDVQSKISIALAATQSAGKAGGIFGADRAYRDMGATMIALGSDTGVLRQGLDRLVTENQGTEH